jgi:hypothetical protein
MRKDVEIEGKTIQVEVSTQAQAALKNRSAPLKVEMELYFSCLIRKAINFDVEHTNAQAVDVGDNLQLSFRPVMTEVCQMSPDVDAPPVTDFPIANIKPYVPHWVRIDFVRGKWCGEFGYR